MCVSGIVDPGIIRIKSRHGAHIGAEFSVFTPCESISSSDSRSRSVFCAKEREDSLDAIARSYTALVDLLAIVRLLRICYGHVQ